MKRSLPSKLCLVCERPFTWRKKWERDWEHVKYCSKKCASGASKNRRESARALPNTDSGGPAR